MPNSYEIGLRSMTEEEHRLRIAVTEAKLGVYNLEVAIQIHEFAQILEQRGELDESTILRQKAARILEKLQRQDEAAMASPLLMPQTVGALSF